MRKDKVIKRIIIICLLVILISFNSISNATLELTEEKLKSALDNVCGYKKTVEYVSEDGSKSSTTVNNEDITYKIDMNKKIIELNFGEEYDYSNCIINYNLEKTNSPEFTYSLTYNNDMNAEKVLLEYLIGENISIILLEAVANTEGILPEDVSTVVFERFGELFAMMMQIYEDTSEGIDIAKKIHNKLADISNEYMKVVYEVENETEEEYKVKGTMTINGNADFSKLEGSALKSLQDNSNKVQDNFDNSMGNIIIDGFNSVQDSIQDDNYDIEINSERVHNTVIMANQLLKNNLKGTGKYSNATKYPNAGLENNIFVPIIKALIGMLVISLAVMIIKVRKRNED